jgi:hypothetical protein
VAAEVVFFSSGLRMPSGFPEGTGLFCLGPVSCANKGNSLATHNGTMPDFADESLHVPQSVGV